jgi:hypothetical protein
LSEAASDLPGIDFVAANVRDCASDAEALAAFTEAVQRQHSA